MGYLIWYEDKHAQRNEQWTHTRERASELLSVLGVSDELRTVDHVRAWVVDGQPVVCLAVPNGWVAMAAQIEQYAQFSADALAGPKTGSYDRGSGNAFHQCSERMADMFLRTRTQGM